MDRAGRCDTGYDLAEFEAAPEETDRRERKRWFRVSFPANGKGRFPHLAMQTAATG